jgi:hypothetical protein
LENQGGTKIENLKSVGHYRGVFYAQTEKSQKNILVASGREKIFCLILALVFR